MRTHGNPACSLTHLDVDSLDISLEEELEVAEDDEVAAVAAALAAAAAAIRAVVVQCRKEEEQEVEGVRAKYGQRVDNRWAKMRIKKPSHQNPVHKS